MSEVHEKPLKYKYEVKPFDQQIEQKNTVLPRHSYVWGLIASRGGGKTSLIMRVILDFQKGKFDELYYFSPTFYNDEKLQLILTTKGVLRTKEKKQNAVERILHGRKKPSGRVPLENIVTSNFRERLQDIIDQKKEDNSKKTLIVFDDLAAGNFYKSPEFIDATFQGRHLEISMIYVSQSYFQVTKQARMNTTYWSLFKTGNNKEIDNFYTEHHAYLDKETWIEIYKKVTKPQFHFLCINYQNAPNHMLYNSLKTQIFVEDDE